MKRINWTVLLVLAIVLFLAVYLAYFYSFAQGVVKDIPDEPKEIILSDSVTIEPDHKIGL